MKISVAVSTYRRSDLLIRLLDSINVQNYDNCEIIIVDDASGDDTPSKVNKYKENHPEMNIRFYVNEQNLGVGESKKRAYKECNGDIIIFSDDDDYYIDPSYFFQLNDIYKKNADCIMTITSGIIHYEKENKYVPQEFNVVFPITNKAYFNGFVFQYSKPPIIAISMKAASLEDNSLDQLLYFNDTPIYLFKLLTDGMVYPLKYPVGIYCLHGKNMMGNARPEFILCNLEAKDDIFRRAMKKNMVTHPRKWYYYNIGMTANYYLKGNKKVSPDDRLVWKWVKDHFRIDDYYRFMFSVIISRIKNKLPINIKYLL